MLVAEAAQASTSFSGSTMALSMALSLVLLVLACLAAVLKWPLAASEDES